MKLTFLLSFSTAVLSMATDFAMQANSGLEKRYEEQRLANSEIELLYMMTHLSHKFNQALKNGVKPEFWHHAKMSLRLIEKSFKKSIPALNEHEQYQIRNEIDSIRKYVLPKGDIKVIDACNNDTDIGDSFCAYYNFPGYAGEVTRLAKKAEILKDAYGGKKGPGVETNNEMKDQLSSVRDDLEMLEVAPVDKWRSQGGFSKTQKSLRNSEKIAAEASKYLKIKAD
ncbi:hypothetical protein OXX80_007014 [Metschnikowia pulcherrima]